MECLDSFSVVKPNNIAKKMIIELFGGKATSTIEQGKEYLCEIFEENSDRGTLKISFSILHKKFYTELNNDNEYLFKEYIDNGNDIELKLSYMLGEKEYNFFIALYNYDYISIQIISQMGNIHEVSKDEAINHNSYMEGLLEQFLSKNNNYSIMTRSGGCLRV